MWLYVGQNNRQTAGKGLECRVGHPFRARRRNEEVGGLQVAQDIVNVSCKPDALIPLGFAPTLLRAAAAHKITTRSGTFRAFTARTTLRGSFRAISEPTHTPTRALREAAFRRAAEPASPATPS